jgi:hypothetical protein
MRSIYLRRHEPMVNIDDKNMGKGAGNIMVANFMLFLQNPSSKHIESLPKLICN